MQIQVDKMAVNAAIEKLIAQDDPNGDAAQIVIEYMRHHKPGAPISFEYETEEMRSGRSTTGYAAGHGNVSIDNTETESKSRSFGIHKDRVGHYKIWKKADGIIYFHHFWKSDAATQTDVASHKEYVLCYNTSDLSPKSFGVINHVFWFRFKLLNRAYEIYRLVVTPIYGKFGHKFRGIHVNETIYI